MFRKKTHRSNGLIMRNDLSYLVRELAFINGTSITSFCEKAVNFYLVHREKYGVEKLPLLTDLQRERLQELLQTGKSKQLDRASEGVRKQRIYNRPKPKKKRGQKIEPEPEIKERRMMDPSVLRVRLPHEIYTQIWDLRIKIDLSLQELFIAAVMCFITHHIDQLLGENA
jgi:hypothetical protein